MKTAEVGKFPFLINFVEKIDQEKFDRAIECMNLTTSSYDPKTQTSRFSMSGGTALTYGSTGILNSDTVQTDT